MHLAHLYLTPNLDPDHEIFHQAQERFGLSALEKQNLFLLTENIPNWTQLYSTQDFKKLHQSLDMLQGHSAFVQFLQLATPLLWVLEQLFSLPPSMTLYTQSFQFKDAQSFIYWLCLQQKSNHTFLAASLIAFVLPGTDESREPELSKNLSKTQPLNFQGSWSQTLKNMHIYTYPHLLNPKKLRTLDYDQLPHLHKAVLDKSQCPKTLSPTALDLHGFSFAVLLHRIPFIPQGLDDPKILSVYQYLFDTFKNNNPLPFSCNAYAVLKTASLLEIVEEQHRLFFPLLIQSLISQYCKKLFCTPEDLCVSLSLHNMPQRTGNNSSTRGQMLWRLALRTKEQGLVMACLEWPFEAFEQESLYQFFLQTLAECGIEQIFVVEGVFPGSYCHECHEPLVPLPDELEWKERYQELQLPLDGSHDHS